MFNPIDIQNSTLLIYEDRTALLVKFGSRVSLIRYVGTDHIQYVFTSELKPFESKNANPV